MVARALGPFYDKNPHILVLRRLDVAFFVREAMPSTDQNPNRDLPGRKMELHFCHRNDSVRDH
jgi:hypothetical protein